MPPSNRREFLKLAAAASLAATKAPFSWARPPARSRAWVTSQDRRMEELKPPILRTVSGESASEIPINTTNHYQEILDLETPFTDPSFNLQPSLVHHNLVPLL